MWEIDNLSQLIGFLYSAALGGFYCVAYDILRALRREIKLGTAAVFATDILYSVLCAITCFCFLLSVTGGEPRAFVFAGAAVGFVIIRLTVSRILVFVFSKMLKAGRFVFDRFSSLLGRFFTLIGKGTDFAGEKVKKIYVLCSNTLKKYLKKK